MTDTFNRNGKHFYVGKLIPVSQSLKSYLPNLRGKKNELQKKRKETGNET